MTAHTHRWLLLVAACGGIAFAHCAQSQPGAPPGPFAKVPPLPTACYTKNETFADRLATARQAVLADRAKQQAINDKIEQDYASLDPMAKAQRMQQWMMENPQEAMKVMQANQAVGAEMTSAAPDLSADESRFANEQKDFVQRYRTAMSQAQAPADARMAALNKKLEPNGCGFGDAECSIPAWAYTELDAVLRMRDAAYASTCPQWWGASGQVQAFLKQRRDWIVNKYLPLYAKGDEIKLQQFAIMNTPGASWKSTMPHDEAAKYMDTIQQLYQLRLGEPYCTPQACDRLR